MALIHKEPYITPEMLAPLEVNTNIDITGGTYKAGGISKSANGLVVVNVRFTASATSATISGLPNPKETGNYIPCYVIRMDNNTAGNIFAYIASQTGTTSPTLYLNGLTSGGQYAVHACYVYQV